MKEKSKNKWSKKYNNSFATTIHKKYIQILQVGMNKDELYKSINPTCKDQSEGIPQPQKATAIYHTGGSKGKGQEEGAQNN